LYVQIDDAFLPYMHERMVPPMSNADYLRWAQMRVDALNHALRDIPEERSRYHICWGSWNGPHAFDVPLKDIIGLLLQVRTGHYSFEAANPRHAHEWRVWQSVKLAPGKILIPGVISHATNIVEHPELVAERIVRLAKIVGRENVMGGTDCGFAQSPFARRVHPTIMWAKLKSLAEGARIATRALWGTRAAAEGPVGLKTSHAASRLPPPHGYQSGGEEQSASVSIRRGRCYVVQHSLRAGGTYLLTQWSSLGWRTRRHVRACGTRCAWSPRRADRGDASSRSIMPAMPIA